MVYSNRRYDIECFLINMREVSRNPRAVPNVADLIGPKMVGSLIDESIRLLEGGSPFVRVSNGLHSTEQVIQRLYGVRKNLVKNNLHTLSYDQLRKAEALGLSIAVLTVICEARDLGVKF